jgi:exopolyphosphatase/guanosine-5'-triphosphate,3'-diphosphate pyrophosphatase
LKRLTRIFKNVLANKFIQGSLRTPLSFMPSFLKTAQNQTSYAAIDLGSNALRAVIIRENGKSLEVLKNIREPLRLGEDVFATGAISAEKMDLTEEAFIKLLHSFTEYNVTKIRAMATSAMRDSSNGIELAERIYGATGIWVETIKGTQEARFILDAVKSEVKLSKQTALLMDIGGGSTELTIVRNEKIIGVHSFNIGTVRLLHYKNQDELEMRTEVEIKKMLKFISKHNGKKKFDLFIGTGGNLRRIGKIRKKTLGKSSEYAMFSEIEHMEHAILSMSYVDRIRRLELDQNRADVILPAIMLTHHLMEKLGLKKILLPKVGLKEGIILSMLDKKPKKFILKD